MPRSRQKQSFRLPFIVSAPDYHAFKPYAEFLAQVCGAKVRAREVNPSEGVEVEADVEIDNGGPYFAVFYDCPYTAAPKRLVKEFLAGVPVSERSL